MGYIFVTRKEIWKGTLKHFVSVGYIFVTRKQRGSLGVRMDVFCVRGLHFVTTKVVVVRVSMVSRSTHCTWVTFL